MTRLLRLIAMVYKLVGGDLRAVSEKNGFGVGPVEMVMVRGQLGPGLTRLLMQGWEALNTNAQALGVDAILDAAHRAGQEDAKLGPLMRRGKTGAAIEEARHKAEIIVYIE